MLEIPTRKKTKKRKEGKTKTMPALDRLTDAGDDDDWEEGNRTLDAFIDDEMENRQIDAQEGGSGK